MFVLLLPQHGFLCWRFRCAGVFLFCPTASAPPVYPGHPRLEARAQRCRPDCVPQLFAATSFDPFAADGERSLFCPRWLRPISTRWLSSVSSCLSPLTGHLSHRYIADGRIAAYPIDVFRSLESYSSLRESMRLQDGDVTGKLTNPGFVR